MKSYLPINRHGPCIGLTLFKWKQVKWELWYAPRNYKCETHTHPNQNIRITFIYGVAMFVKRPSVNSVEKEKIFVTAEYDFGTKFNVRHNEPHYFQTFEFFPLLFLNKETYLNGRRPTSAAEDFVLTEEII